MVETIKMLQQEDKSGPIEFLSAHPSPENRLGYIEEKIVMNRLKPERLRIAPEDYKKNVLNQLK